MQVVYLGYVVCREGISPDPEKVKAVREFPQPHNVKSLRSFLGLASYYRRFIQGFSVVANPLFGLTKKDTDFVWSPACEEAFQTLTRLLTEAPILASIRGSCLTLTHQGQDWEQCSPRSKQMALFDL